MKKTEDVIGALIKEASERELDPFPDHYISLGHQFSCTVSQISTAPQEVLVIAKLSDDLETFRHGSPEEASIPPKVLCWSDVSQLTMKRALKVIKLGLTAEYNSLCANAKIEIGSVNSSDLAPIDPSDIFIFHVIDPTISHAQKLEKRPTSYTAPRAASDPAR
jgi:hypothetical protein